MRKHEGPHSGANPVDGCYGCDLKAKTFHLGAGAVPSRQNKVPPPTANPQWEKGIVGEHRPGGGFMPYLRPDMAPMRVKEHGEKRRDVEAQIRRLKNDPTVFAHERGNN